MPNRTFTYPIRSSKFSVNVEVQAVVCEVESPFQRIEVLDTETLGRLMLLDGHIQLATFDEHAYHELLVQVPMMALTNPVSALVVGGGDGGVLREICKNEGVRHVDLVEIDAAVIDVSKQHLPEVSNGAFDDPRVHVHIEDACGFVRRCNRQYNVIIMDITDVYEDEEGELSEQLFTDEFHADCADILAPGGFLVTQADNHVFCPYSLADVLAKLRRHYANSGWYQGLIPSFGGYSAFCWGSRDGVLVPRLDTEIDLRYLNPATLALAFEPLRFG